MFSISSFAFFELLDDFMLNHLCQTFQDVFFYVVLLCIFYAPLCCAMFSICSKMAWELPLFSDSSESQWPLWGMSFVAVSRGTSATGFYVVPILFHFFAGLFIHWFRWRCVILSCPFVFRSCQQGIYMVLHLKCIAYPLSLYSAYFPFEKPESEVKAGRGAEGSETCLHTKQRAKTWLCEYSIHVPCTTKCPFIIYYYYYLKPLLCSLELSLSTVNYIKIFTYTKGFTRSWSSPLLMMWDFEKCLLLTCLYSPRNHVHL